MIAGNSTSGGRRVASGVAVAVARPAFRIAPSITSSELHSLFNASWPDHRERAGKELVGRAAAVCREQGIEWLHVDYEAYLAPFHERCGFRDTAAGLIRLNTPTD